MVTHVGVISNGSILFRAPLGELKSKQEESLFIVFEANDNEKAIRIIAENNLIAAIENGKVTMHTISKKQMAAIMQQLIKNDLEFMKWALLKTTWKQFL